MAICALLGAMAFPCAARDVGTGPGSTECGIAHEWRHDSSFVTIVYPEDDFIPYCQPIELRAEGFDNHVLIHECHGCDSSRKKYEFSAKKRYEWVILKGGGKFVKMANGPEDTLANTQSVLYQPPLLDPHELRVVEIAVLQHHDDTVKEGVHAPPSAILKFHVFRGYGFVPDHHEGIEIQEERNTYLLDYLDLETFPIDDGLEITEDPFLSCEPRLEAFDLNPLTADFAPATGDILTQDFVVFEATANDQDRIEIYCDASDPCTSTASVLFDVQDDLTYEWEADKGTFFSPFGKEVIYRSPDEPGPVTILLRVRDTGQRYSDPMVEVIHQFDIREDRRIVNIAMIGWIDGDEPNLGPIERDVMPPYAPDPTKVFNAPKLFRESRFRGSYYDQGFQYFDPPGPLPLEWQLMEKPFFGNQWSRVGSVHPWEVARGGLAASANDAPPTSFTDFAAIADWVAPGEPGEASGKHRATLAAHLEVVVRRDCILEIDRDPERFDLIAEVGGTPFGLAGQLGAFMAFGLHIDPLEIGEQKDVLVRILGLRTSEVTVELHEDVRVGPDNNRIQVGLTNREAPWIHGFGQLKLYADLFPVPTDLENLTVPEFPTWNLYFGKDDDPVEQFDTQPCERFVDFINRGRKFDPDGL